jgi:Family of unknown function (DUF5677)
LRRRTSRRNNSVLARRARLEQRFQGSVLESLDRDVASGRLSTPRELHARVLETVQEQLILGLARQPHRVPILVRRIMDRAVSGSALLLAGSWVQTGRSTIDAHMLERAGFEERLRERWGRPLDMLELFRLWCLEAGMELHKDRAGDDDWTYGVLVRLHARVCLVTAEVLALLRSGFPSGAHARWRTAHEIAVVAFFISRHGDDTAERYVCHETVERYRAVSDYQVYASRLGERQFTKDEMAAAEMAIAQLSDRFGRGFLRRYGWAASALGKASVTFRDIEAAVSLDHLRPYYRMASHPTHAGPQGVTFDIGRGRHDVMLAGPSNTGLVEPGQGVAMSLLQVTSVLLTTAPTMGNLAILKCLAEAGDAIKTTFQQTQAKLDRDEDRIRARPNGPDQPADPTRDSASGQSGGI